MARFLLLAFDPDSPLDRGHYLQVIMKRKEISLDDVAEGLGVSKSLISAVLNGKKQSRRIVHELAAFLGEDPEAVFPDKEGNST